MCVVLVLNQHSFTIGTMKSRAVEFVCQIRIPRRVICCLIKNLNCGLINKIDEIGCNYLLYNNFHSSVQRGQ